MCEILNAHFFDDKGLKNILLHSKLQKKEKNVPYEMKYINFGCRYEINQLYLLEFSNESEKKNVIYQYAKDIILVFSYEVPLIFLVTILAYQIQCIQFNIQDLLETANKQNKCVFYISSCHSKG